MFKKIQKSNNLAIANNKLDESHAWIVNGICISEKIYNNLSISRTNKPNFKNHKSSLFPKCVKIKGISSKV